MATVKDEFASFLVARNRLFGQEKNIAIEHEILKENHEILKRDYECLQERFKHEVETCEIMKKCLQGKAEDPYEETNKRLLEDCERERSEKEKYKKMFEEMKAMESENKAVESERKAIIDELMMEKQELLMAMRRQEDDFEILENKFVELAEKFGVVERDYSYLKSLYDAEVAAAASGGETENLIGHGGNNVKGISSILMYGMCQSVLD
ncbi:unnamed protein product [Thlaspi arvense]|uniref:Uncharacterized protein n=1 Tax=Thlaspi arvense TaxID=13288 RepID=A0AAU9SW73_THLAR|nr:unnamed protein product [Thlaspi arvense]